MIHSDTLSVVPDFDKRNAGGIDWYLNSAFPFLPPRVCDTDEVILLQWLRIGQLHGTDQILPEQLSTQDNMT